MKLNQLTKIKSRGKKRLGRGVGSGMGKTAGRGTKGQKARGKIPVGFSGSNLPLYRKLPLRRGQGNPKVSEKFIVINLSELNVFKPKAMIDREELVNAGIIKKNDKRSIKILGSGEIKSSIITRLPVSASARQKIEAAGGRVENV